MFWRSVIDGFLLFSHWQVWLGVISFAMVNFLCLLVIVYLEQPDIYKCDSTLFAPEPRTIHLLHLFTYDVITIASLQVMLMCLLQLSLSSIGPLVFDYYLLKMIWVAVFGGLVFGFFLSFINIHGARKYMVSSTIIVSILGIYLSYWTIDSDLWMLAKSDLRLDPYPNWVETIGFIVLAVGLTFSIYRLLMAVLGQFGKSMRLDLKTWRNGLIPKIAEPLLSSVGGILPAFMWISYVTSSLQRL